jgi:ribonuclease PH
VAVTDAFGWLVERGQLARSPVRRRVAAVSVGIVDGEPRLDLEYTEDVRADVDMNVVMASPDLDAEQGASRTGGSRFVEVQGTGEHSTFDRAQLDALLALAVSGIERLDAEQRRVLAAQAPRGVAAR